MGEEIKKKIKNFRGINLRNLLLLSLIIVVAGSLGAINKAIKGKMKNTAQAQSSCWTLGGCDGGCGEGCIEIVPCDDEPTCYGDCSDCTGMG